MNLDEINDYYSGLKIRTYWSNTSLTIEELNLVTDVFKQLHEEYPNVIIEEIGDCYSEDSIKREERIKNAIPIIKDDYTVNPYYQNHDYFKEHPENKSRHQEFMRSLVAKAKTEKIGVNDDKYVNAKFSAQYCSLGRKIEFNHTENKSLKENMFHEFGHAVAFQYNINNNAIINEIFESSDKNRIEELVSNYATTKVEEFIAEAFMYYHLGRRNSIINKVMNIINDEVLNGKPMSYIERCIYDSINS